MRASGWVLAPHDALPEPTCLSHMLRVLDERPRAGLACADVGDGATPVIDPYFGGILAPATVNEGWGACGTSARHVDVRPPACLDDVGIFDERYFAYCEEADLALRAKARGWESGLVRGAMVKNPYVGSASAAIDYLQLRNTLLQVREHSGLYHACIRFAIALWHLGRRGRAGTARPVLERGRSGAGADRLRAWTVRAAATASVDQALTSPSSARRERAAGSLRDTSWR